MARANSVRSLSAILAILVLSSTGLAQEMPSAVVPTSFTWQPVAQQQESWLPDFLNRLPTPPNRPSSLLQPTAPMANTSAVARPSRYFEEDPLLDPAGNYPQPGWFSSIEVEAVGPHIYKSIVNNVTAGGRAPDTVNLPNRGLNWTAAPRVEVGYRLPSGFGGFALSYRSLSTSGDSNIFGPDGPANLHSRLSLNAADLDYESWEYTPNDLWTMRWRVGGRLAYIYYDSVLNQSINAVGIGSGIVQQHATNMFTAFGPHASVELTRQLANPAWRLLGRADVASLFGRIKQNTSEIAVDPVSPAGVSFGETPVSSSQTSPTVNLLYGLDWQPASMNSLNVFVGYQYEYWWNVGRLSLSQGSQRSRGDLALQGIIARIQFNY